MAIQEKEKVDLTFKSLGLLPAQAAQLQFLNEISLRLQGLLESKHFFQEVVDIIQSKLKNFNIQIWSGSPPSILLAQAGSLNLKDASTFGDAQSPELSLPITKDGQRIAFLKVICAQESGLDDDLLLTFKAIATQIAVSLTNQERYAETKNFNKKLQQTLLDKTEELKLANLQILEQQRLLQKDNKTLRSLIHHTLKTKEIVGESPAILKVLTMVDKIAPTTATVLILGESGTGKELIARRLHIKSDRSSGPFVSVNCSALQEALLESELFGHEKGSFTGAVVQKMGLCETADGGTLFLDEIGEMSPGIQAKLLRFLQEGEFYRIGGKRPIRVNVRVISATNRELENEVKAGRFREDLFYRLNTITLRMPPLRRRKEDIPALVDFFLKSSRLEDPAAEIKKLDPRVMDVFVKYNWPGNIRELQNTIERLKILAENQEIRLEDIPFSIRMPQVRFDSIDLGVEVPLEVVEKNHILRILTYNHGNKTKTAQSLGITVKTLYNKLHRYGMLNAAQIPTENSDAIA